MTTSHETDEETLRAYTPEEVQDELFNHLTFMVPYWINSDHYHYKDASLKEKMSGYMHSLWVSFAGNSGGFSTSISMYAYSTEENAQRNIDAGRNFFPVGLECAGDINDGTLQYHSAENSLKAPESVTAGGPREWTEGEIRAILFNRIAEILNDWEARENVADLDKCAGMVRNIFNLFEGNDPKFEAKIALVSEPHPDDKEYYLENGENYYEEETNLSIPERSLVEAWDFWWEKTQK